ncbi:Caltractin [Tritrichomonas foetus]|uniref:Caltractin n=1 Tax=Tritrichomonas foetus TaxID=1144522 RepID=A0A1J4K1B0_9EUKA|nr:Caltractin [Tritrichomonas foetus]|eukprot:OHT05217.1 Caltractin [Tritrichomonas foetus]
MSDSNTNPPIQKTDEPTREVRDAFDLFDLNRDGVIDPDELKTALNSLGFEFSQQEIQRIIMELDPNNTGTIDFHNFSDLIHSKMAERDQIDQIQMAFDMLDFDKTHKITFKNLKQIAKELGENITDQEIREMLNEADTDNDGEISFEEFFALVRTASFA